jgi:hypothetical protein
MFRFAPLAYLARTAPEGLIQSVPCQSAFSANDLPGARARFPSVDSKTQKDEILQAGVMERAWDHL